MGGARRLTLFIGVVTFMMAIGNTGLVSIMPGIGRLIGIPDYLVASIFSLSAAVWAISSPFWNRYIGQRGCNLFVRLGLAGFVASMFGCALAVELGIVGQRTPLACFLAFFVLRAVFGLLGSAAAIASQTLLAHATRSTQRTQALTAVAGALSLGTIVGPALAPILIFEPLGPVTPMLAFGIMAGVVLAVASRYLPPERFVTGEREAADLRTVGLREIWRNRSIAVPLNFGMLVCCAQAVNIYTIGFIVIDRSGLGPIDAQGMVGMTMTAGAIAALAGQWGLPRVIRLSPGSMSATGAAMGLFGNVLPLIGGDVLAAGAGFAVASFGFGLARPGFTAAASLAGHDDDQVAIATAISLIAGASIVLPPVLAAAAYAAWQPAPFAIAVLLVAGALPLALCNLRPNSLFDQVR